MDKLWYRNTLHPALILLLPLSWLFRGVVIIRRLLYQYGILKSTRAPVPVIVIGNISVGGTGKTPLVIWLAALLKQNGYNPGIVSRGYGGSKTDVPRRVYINDDPAHVGDEPLLIARRSGCPVVVFRKRPQAIQTLLQHSNCDIVISDDGMQHYPMARDIEIAVVDGLRQLGNGQCLPAGPLREPPSRLDSVDFIVVKDGHADDVTMCYAFNEIVSLVVPETRQPLNNLKGATVHAVAGIGHPSAFFELLERQSIRVIQHQFPDHHRFNASDLDFADDFPIIMTEKDAVKCAGFATPRCWALPIEAELPKAFADTLLTTLQETL